MHNCDSFEIQLHSLHAYYKLFPNKTIYYDGVKTKRYNSVKTIEYDCVKIYVNDGENVLSVNKNKQ